MKAFQVQAPHQFALQDIAPAEVKPGEVQVRVAHAGICGSDMHIIHGQNAFVQFPRVTGHEFSGTVAAVGEGVDKVRIGDRVTVDPVISCGKCYPCRIGRPNVCTALQVIGVHRDGGFEELVTVPAANLYRLPESLALANAALIEPYSIALNVLSRMAPYPGDTLLVYGAGVIGLTIVQVAKAMGIERVLVTDILDSRLDTALSLGASEVINGKDQDLEAFVGQYTEGEGVPLIADAACIPALLPQILRLASPAGRIGLLGFSSTPSDLAQLEVIKKELTLVGSRLNNRKFGEVIDMMTSGRLDTSALISHRVGFDEMIDAIHLIENHPEQVRKVLVGFGE